MHRISLEPKFQDGAHFRCWYCRPDHAKRLTFSDFLMGSLPPATGRKMHFPGTEIGLDDGVKALTQLGLIKVA
jgi:hypothetical protein